MNKDWRIVNQHKYLSNKKLIKTRFRSTENCDHAHCTFCWDKFSDMNGDLHSGYRTINGKWWICEKCFDDFHKQFNWDVNIEE